MRRRTLRNAAAFFALAAATTSIAREPDPAATSVYVDAANGLDANPGTREQPRRTIGAGIARFASAECGQVLVAEGTYAESVVLRGCIDLFGGFEAAGWTRHWSRVTTISGGATAMLGQNLVARVLVDGFTIRSADGVWPSDSSYAVRVVNSNGAVELTRLVLKPGRGAAGPGGSNGLPGIPGAIGGDGENGCDGCQSANAGAGGLPAAAGPVSLRGGAGGSGGYDGAGQPGQAAGGGASGGIAGPFATCPSTSGGGGPGMAGTDGANGTTGTYVDLPGTVTGPLYELPRGASGTTGANGTGGGGGGGGGGGDAGFCDADEGGGGGAGGNGAFGAVAGSGGFGGGGSFGVYVHSSFVYVLAVRIDRGTGGRGGDGGNGASGKQGGPGGTPGQARGDSGAGGMGGSGGDSGHAGASVGGTGGPSIGVAKDSSSFVPEPYVRFYGSPAAAAGGSGGTGPLGTAAAGGSGKVANGLGVSVSAIGPATLLAFDSTLVRDPAGGELRVRVQLVNITDLPVSFPCTIDPGTATDIGGTCEGLVEPWTDIGIVSIVVPPAPASTPTQQFGLTLGTPVNAQLGNADATITLLSPTFFRDGFE